ncbi:chloride channel protein [compost metagenome]
MAAFFAAAGKVPLAASIIVGEMGKNYYLIAPTLAAAYIARELTGEKTVYPPQLKERPII